MLREAALYVAIGYGGVDIHPKSKVWQSPSEAANYLETAPSRSEGQDELVPSSDSSSSAGMPTPSESDCTLPNEEQIAPESTHEALHAENRSTVSEVNAEDATLNKVITESDVIKQLIKDLKDIDLSPIDMNTDHAPMQIELMTSVHEKLDAIKADCKQQLDHVSVTRQMMNETIQMIKDQPKTLNERSKSSNTAPNIKQTVPLEDTAASTFFESPNCTCRDLRIQVYHSQLAACRNHAKAKPGTLGDCCLSSIARWAGRDREAQIIGYMTLANQYRDKARGEVEYRQRNEHTRQEESNLKDVLRLLREITPK